MKACPRCDADIGDTAIACACGWSDRKARKRIDEPTIRIPCCSPTCANLAMCRIEISGRSMPFCNDHYQAYFTEKAKETCRKLGLDTIAKRRTWVKQNLGPTLKRLTSREPGEDEDFTYLQA